MKKQQQLFAICLGLTALAVPVLAQNRTAPMNFAGRYSILLV